MVACAVVAFPLDAPAQAVQDAVRGSSSDATTAARQTFTGMAILPSGSPAVGAVVTTSAGGQALCGEDGSFSIDVDVPFAAERLDVAVVAAADQQSRDSLRASISIRAGVPHGSTDVGLVGLSSVGTCSPAWIPEFGGQPGTSGLIQAMAVYNDGSGAALYVGGQFAAINGIAAGGLAKWDGTSWTSLGSGVTGTGITCMTVFDDGGGAELYVGGFFTAVDGVSANSVAKWDGSSWTTLGSGISSIVNSMAVFDDGGGDDLYVGGLFTAAGGVSASRIARWDGSNWSALGSGMTGGGTTGVFSMAVFDDGGGDALYAGGQFTTAGGGSANRMAKWDGSSWSALGSGMNGRVNALRTYDDGGGDSLYAGGEFTTAGGGSANFIAEWDGSSWSALGSGLSGDVTRVLALGIYDGGSGRELFVGGDFTSAGGVSANEVAKWDGSSWSAVGAGVAGPGPLADIVSAFAVFNDGGGGQLYAGGSFDTAGSTVPANSIARWDGSGWSATGVGMTDMILSLAVYDDGGGRSLYAGGLFTYAGTTAANRIAKWTGSSWSALGSGVNDVVYAMTVYNDGGGAELYAAGDFTTAGGTSVSRIAKWDGSTWSALGSGLNGTVFAMTVFDDGGGPELYVGGSFTSAGGSSANRIAKWDGTSWSSVGSGMNNGVFALTVFNDGGGNALYAGGAFTTAGGGSASRVAKWNGSSWSALGTGVSGGLNRVYSLAPFRSGSTSYLAAGGEFTTAGGVSASFIAAWDGSSWSALGSGMDDAVFSLTVYDDGTGSGSMLHAGGPFTVAGGVAANSIARWDGSNWSPLGGGLTLPNGVESPVRSMVKMAVGSLQYLFVGGAFMVSPSGDSFVAQWGGC